MIWSDWEKHHDFMQHDLSAALDRGSCGCSSLPAIFQASCLQSLPADTRASWGGMTSILALALRHKKRKGGMFGLLTLNIERDNESIQRENFDLHSDGMSKVHFLSLHGRTANLKAAASLVKQRHRHAHVIFSNFQNHTQTSTSRLHAINNLCDPMNPIKSRSFELSQLRTVYAQAQEPHTLP